MKIKSFEIKNFRSIRHINVQTKDLMVFVGKNNAGKSNILRALNAFFSRKVTVLDIPPKSFERNELEIKVVFTDVPRIVRKTLDIFESDLSITRIFVITDDRIKFSKEIINNRELKSGFSNDLPKMSEVRDYLEEILPKFYYVPALRDLSDSEKFKKGSLMQDLLIPFLDDRIFDDGASITNHLSSIQEIMEKRSAVIEANINQLLYARLDDFKRILFSFENVDIKKALTPSLLVETESSERLIPAIEQGAGTQNFIILALAQYYASGKFPRDLIIAFEEPEISLHAGAQRRMWDLIINLSQIIQQQIFVTTHSTIFIDENIDSIYLVRKKKGETSVTQSAINRDILRILGIRGSDYFQSDALIFVEGLSDYEVYRLWAIAREPASWEGILFTFIPLGGLNALSDYRYDDFIRLTHRIYAIIDSDKSEESAKIKDISQDVVKKIQDLGGKIKILNVRSLENFFTEEAVKKVWPKGAHLVNSDIFNDRFSNMEKHLLEIKKADNKAYFTEQGIFDQGKHDNVIYSKVKDAKKIAEAMVELKQIPNEFTNILDEFAKDYKSQY